VAEEDNGQPAPPAQPAANEEAPYGYTKDPKTGVMRPRKRAGRSGVVAGRAPAAAQPAGASPSLEQLKAAAAEEGPQEAPEDRVPGTERRRGRQRGRKKKSDAETPAPPFRAGPIASGMNRIYARIGKVVKAMDREIGIAIISITKKENADDVTVGEAWEEVARTNPRIRVILLRLIEGGAWSQLFLAHLPIAVAIVMKDGIRQRIPFGRFLGAMIDDDDDEEAGEDSPGDLLGMLGQLTAGDLGQVAAVFNGAMAQAANSVPRSAGMHLVRTPIVEDDGTSQGP
jgi:hypothetical protein